MRIPPPDIRLVGAAAGATGLVAGPELTRRVGISKQAAYNASMLVTGAALVGGLAATGVNGTPVLRWVVDGSEQVFPAWKRLSAYGAIAAFSLVSAAALGVFVSSDG